MDNIRHQFFVEFSIFVIQEKTRILGDTPSVYMLIKKNGQILLRFMEIRNMEKSEPAIIPKIIVTASQVVLVGYPHGVLFLTFNEQSRTDNLVI